MLYFDPDRHHHNVWSLDEREESATIARDFIAGEGQLLRLLGDRGELSAQIEEFLIEAEPVPLSIMRSVSGQILIRAGITGTPLLLTGRTADVLGRYLDGEPVRMSDRFDMTQRLPTVRRVHAV